VNVDTESLESILSGGIAFTADPSSGAAPEGQLYTLHDTE
jgi:paraquat-inducible protein B